MNSKRIEKIEICSCPNCGNLHLIVAKARPQKKDKGHFPDLPRTRDD